MKHLAFTRPASSRRPSRRTPLRCGWAIRCLGHWTGFSRGNRRRPTPGRRGSRRFGCFRRCCGFTATTPTRPRSSTPIFCGCCTAKTSPPATARTTASSRRCSRSPGANRGRSPLGRGITGRRPCTPTATGWRHAAWRSPGAMHSLNPGAATIATTLSRRSRPSRFLSLPSRSGTRRGRSLPSRTAISPRRTSGSCRPTGINCAKKTFAFRGRRIAARCSSANRSRHGGTTSRRPAITSRARIVSPCQAT